MTVNERIKAVRNDAGLSIKDFSARIGVSGSAVSRLESGENAPSERTLKVICSEFKVNYPWLKDGIGDQYSGLAETMIDKLVEEQGLDELDRRIIAEYVKLSEAERTAFKKYIRAIFLTEKADGD